MINWQDTLIRDGLPWTDAAGLSETFCGIRTLSALKHFLDTVHIRYCLVKPYQEADGHYPLVEFRELLPSFDNAMFEYTNLPGFSMVAFARQLNYFKERFQYDILYPVVLEKDCCLLENNISAANMQTFLARLPRRFQDNFRSQFHRTELSDIGNYPALLPFLLNMDRAHVMSLNSAGEFYLSGIFASFVNDLDSVLKRFGQRIGKFRPGDSEMYARNRMFVYQFLMELYGFPIVSERRTSAAMFARRLTRCGDHFLLRVLGQTDRTITTYICEEGWHTYPKIEKLALIAVEPDQEDAIRIIGDKGFFLDEKRRVIILRVTYRQHRYNANNVRQDRALSVVSQEIIHPLTGEILTGLNIIRDATNMYLRLNDIVRGEYTSRIVYKRNEVIESTDSDENRLKVLYYWLTKNQRRMIDYSDDFFGKINKVLTGYLFAPEKDEAFAGLRELHLEVCARLGYIQQARKVRTLEELCSRMYHGEKLPYRRTLQLCLEIVTDLKFEIVNFFPELVEKAIACLEHITSDRYLIRTYIQPAEGRKLSKGSIEIRKNYGALVAANDEFRKVLRSRLASAKQQAQNAPKPTVKKVSKKDIEQINTIAKQEKLTPEIIQEHLLPLASSSSVTYTFPEI